MAVRRRGVLTLLCSWGRPFSLYPNVAPEPLQQRVHGPRPDAVHRLRRRRCLAHGITAQASVGLGVGLEEARAAQHVQLPERLGGRMQRDLERALVVEVLASESCQAPRVHVMPSQAGTEDRAPPPAKLSHSRHRRSSLLRGTETGAARLPSASGGPSFG